MDPEQFDMLMNVLREICGKLDDIKNGGIDIENEVVNVKTAIHTVEYAVLHSQPGRLR